MSPTVSTASAPVVELAPGQVPYAAAIIRMRAEAAAIRSGDAPERIWLLEHPPLYTAGTSAKPEDLTDANRFPIFEAGRGGQWTYHGPGQRVAYVMLDLAQRHGTVAPRDVHAYVGGLEAWLIATLATFGVQGERRSGRVGIWVSHPNPVTGAVQEDKVAAIGVKVTRWVTWHGVSLNVAPDLDHFGGIVPCGIRAHGVTSLRALGCGATMEDLDAALAASWASVFGEALTLPRAAPAPGIRPRPPDRA